MYYSRRCSRLRIFVFSMALSLLTWGTAVHASTLQLNWIDNSDNEDGFRIERSVGGVSDQIFTVGPNVTTYTDTNLQAGVTYCYRVRAFNSAGESAPTNQVCATVGSSPPPSGGSGAALTVSPTSASPGTAVSVSWSGIGSPASRDWIGLYQASASDNSFITWMYVSCSTSPGSARASGTCSLSLPSSLASGNYQLRLFADESFTRLATSALTVSTSGSTPPPPSGGSGAALAVSPTSANPGAAVSVSWSGIGSPAPRDWIGLYQANASDTSFITWMYVSCSTSPGSARASGTCSLSLPSSLASGSYQLRLFANESFTRLAVTDNLSVGGAASTPPLSGGSSTSVTVNPGSAGPGATVSVSWSGITSPTSRDWIGLYQSSASDTSFLAWMYVSCSTSAGSARASGTCSLPLPSSLASGGYQLRLFANDGYTRLAVSSTLNVTTVGTMLLGNALAAPEPEESTASTAHASPHWTDYEFAVKMQSGTGNAMGLLFRYMDDQNHYRFVWNGNSNSRRLEKVQNGAALVLADDTTGYTSGQSYQLRIVARGSALQVLVDGSQVFSVTDPTFIDGTVGLYSSGNNTVSFDDVAVVDLSDGATLLARDFDDGAFRGWTVVDSASAQSPSVWSAAGGSLAQSSSINATAAVYTMRSWSDYRLGVKMTSSGNGPSGALFRYQDHQNYYRFSWNNGSGLRRLEKYENGTISVLAEDTTPSVSGRTYGVEIVADGPALTVAVDGDQVFSVTDSTFSIGAVALYSEADPGSSFDDVYVEDLASGAVLLWDDFDDNVMAGWTAAGGETNGSRSSTWSVQGGALVQSVTTGSAGAARVGSFVLY